MTDLTCDAFFNGRIKISQARNGYRFSIDAIVAAAAVHPKAGDKVLDLGTGCGIIPLILAHRHSDIRISGVEIQADLADLARLNVAANHQEDRVSILHADMRSLTPPMIGGPADWIVSNPPYRKPFSGRVNPNAQRALARHEINITLKELIHSASRLLRTGARFIAIYAAERAVDLMHEMRMNGIEPKWLQSIHSHAGANAKMVLVLGMKGGQPGIQIIAPLVIYAPDGGYTDLVQAMMAP